MAIAATERLCWPAAYRLCGEFSGCFSRWGGSLSAPLPGRINSRPSSWPFVSTSISRLHRGWPSIGFSPKRPQFGNRTTSTWCGSTRTLQRLPRRSRSTRWWCVNCDGASGWSGPRFLAARSCTPMRRTGVRFAYRSKRPRACWRCEPPSARGSCSPRATLTSHGHWAVCWLTRSDTSCWPLPITIPVA